MEPKLLKHKLLGDYLVVIYTLFGPIADTQGLALQPSNEQH
jgi:hypothetical protein